MAIYFLSTFWKKNNSQNLASLPPFIDFENVVVVAAVIIAKFQFSVCVCDGPSHHLTHTPSVPPVSPHSSHLPPSYANWILTLHVLSLSHSFFILPISLSLLLLVFVCSKPRARLTHTNYDRLLTHTHARTQLEDGFFLFFVFLLLHPLTAAAAGHHPGSSSFASQPEHSGRGRPARIVHGQRSPGIFCSSLSLSTPWKSKWSHWKIRTRPTRICSSSCLLLWLSLFFFAHTLTRSVHTDRRGKKKKSVAHTHAHTHTFFRPTLFRPRRKFHFFHTPRKIAIFRIPAVPRRFTPSRRHSRIAPGIWP